MRQRKPTKGRVPGAKFTLSKENDDNDLKKAKEQILKELKEKEENSKEWYDKEVAKNMK